MADIRISQEHVDVAVEQAVPDIRVSQVHVDVLVDEAVPNVRVSQVHVDVVAGNAPPPNIRISQLHVDVLVEPDAPAAPDPDVVTITASGVTFECATLFGSIDPNFIPVSGFFQYGLNDPPAGELSTPLLDFGAGDTAIEWDEEVCDLLPNTTYYFRAVAITYSGALAAYYGDVLSFTTDNVPASEVAATQLVVETLEDAPDADINVSHLAIETIAAPDPPTAEVSALVIETIADVIPPPPILTPPEEGEDLCPAIDDPIAFGSWVSSSGERLWFAEADLPDSSGYYGGWKSDRILSLGQIRRSLSSTDWQPEIGSFSVTLADDDYEIRDRLNTGAGRYFYKKEMDLYFITPRGRELQSDAKRIAIGFVDTDPVYDPLDESMSVQFQCRDLIGVAMGWTSRGQASIPRRRINDYTLPTAPAQPAYHKGVPLPFGVLQFDPPSGYLRPRRLVSAWWVQDTVLPDANVWRRFMIAGGAVKGNFSWAYDPTPEADITDPTGVEEDSGDGTEWIFPGTAGWISVMGTSQPYEDIVGADGITRRWTFCYGRGPKADLVASGTAQLTWDGEGVEASGDSTGPLLTDLHDQFALLYENVIAVDQGEGYYTGPWLQGRTFTTQNIPVVDYISIEALKAMREDELGEPLEGAGVFGAFGDLIAVGDELVNWQMCGDFRIGPNRFWQTSLHAINHNISADDTSPLLDQFDIHIRTFTPSTRIDELITDWVYQYRRDFARNGEWLQDDSAGALMNLQTTNEASEVNWSGRRTANLGQFHYLRNQTHKQFILSRIMNRKSNFAPGYVELEGDQCLLGPEYDIGKYVDLTHWRGAAANGWTGRPFWILSNTLLPDNRRVRLEMLDIWDLVSRSEFP